MPNRDGHPIARRISHSWSMELTLSLEGKARRRALAKARSLMQDAPPRDGGRGPAEPSPCDGEPGPRGPRRRSAPVPYV